MNLNAETKVVTRYQINIKLAYVDDTHVVDILDPKAPSLIWLITAQ